MSVRLSVPPSGPVMEEARVFPRRSTPAPSAPYCLCFRKPPALNNKQAHKLFIASCDQFFCRIRLLFSQEQRRYCRPKGFIDSSDGARIGLQLTPALTDFKGTIIFICYRRISVIAIIENKEKLFKGLKNSFCYRRISVTGGSVIAGFNCISKTE